MNVIIFVTTMIMLLSIMTYARLQTYRDSQAFQTIFRHYMQEDERGYINERAEEAYMDIEVKDSEKKDGKASPKIDASPRIGIKLLIDPTRTAKQKEWEQTKILLKNLIKTLYAEQPFYKKIEQERPDFIDALFIEITRAIDSLSPDKRPKTAMGLANLKLEDPKLDKVLYKMLHGAFYMNVTPEELKQKRERNKKLSEEDNETAIDDDETSKQTDEYKSPEGYYSLLDYVTTQKMPKVRVYLAPRNVLLAIFKDPTTVDNIINQREELYRLAIKDSPIEELNTTFKNQFEKNRDPYIEESSLNFSVSKTNPKYYR